MRLVPAVAVVLAVLAVPAQTSSAPLGHGVPVLMYHVIAKPLANAPYPALYVPTAEFAAQVSWLKKNGYHAVTLARVYEHWRTGKSLPARPIVLSFDDGSRSIYVHARPVLDRLGWPAVLNLKLENMKGEWGLSPRWIRKLIASGWELASHTITHPDLTALGPSALNEEVAGSRQRLRRQFGVPVDFFCYPAGRYDATVISAVQRAGYLGATSTRSGLARPTDLYTLARVRIDGGDGASGLARKLRALGG